MESWSSQQVLRLAAMFGPRIPRALLVAVSTRSEMAEEKVMDALEECERARLLAEVDTEAYQLTHNLIREVLLSELGLARRTLLHRWIAEALEEGPGISSVEALAYHYAQSGAIEKAMYYLEQAGDVASARYAHAEAAHMYQEVLARLEPLGLLAERARMREKLGGVLTALAQYDQALDILELTSTYYRQQGDQESLLRTLAQLGSIHRWRGTAAEGLKRLLPLLESLTDAAPTPATTRFFLALTHLYFGIGDYRQQLAMAEQAATMARALADERLLLHAQGRRGASLSMLGYLEEAREVLSADVLPLAETLREVQLWRQTLTNLGAIATYQGQLLQARTYLEQATTLSEQIGDRSGLATLTFQRGLLAYHLGEWEMARDAFARGKNLIEYGALLAYPLGGLGLLHFAEGDHTAAMHSWEQALDQFKRYQDERGLRWIHSLLAEKELLRGQAEQALVHLAPFVRLHEPPDGDLDARELLPLLAWIHVELDQSLQAQELLTPLLADLRAAHMRLALTDALRVQALLFLRQAEWVRAEVALSEALEMARSFPWPYGEAKLLMVYGQLQARQHQQDSAQHFFREALAILTRLGERTYAQKLTELLG